MVFDFKEIPQANLATGMQDEFELFSRDFLEYIGYHIISEPNRGQDGGIDILVEEMREGVAGQTKIRWLVSCKHFAHSGKAVGVDDEINVEDRVSSNNCDGFIGFYSTISSSRLMGKLEGLAKKKNIQFQIFHRGNIENYLLKNKNGTIIAKRYFPISMQNWKQEISENEISRIRNEYYEEYIRRKRHGKN